MRSSSTDPLLDPPPVAGTGDLRERARARGVPVAADGRTAIALDAPDAVHVVVSGALDVFAVAAAPDDVRSGKRTYLFTVSAGEALFGLAPDPLRPTRLIAVGNVRTDVRRLPLGAVDEPGRGPALLGGALDGWIAHLSAAVATLVAPRPRVPHRIAPGEPVAPGPDGRVGVDGGTAWVLAPGDTVFADTADLEPDAVVFPLSGEAWLTPLAPGPRETIGTTEALARGLAVEGLAHFQRIALDALGTNLRLETADELNRIREATARDADRVRAVLGAVAGLVGRTGAAERPTPGDPAWQAVARIARFLGRADPPALAGRDRDLAGEARIVSILRAAGLAWRPVRIDARLLGGDGHAIVAFKAGGAPVALVPERRGSYRLFDPATGRTEPLTRDRLAALATEAYAVYPTVRGARADGRAFLAMALRRSAGDVRSILFFGLLAAVLGLAVPEVTGTLIDTAIPNSEQRLVLELALVLAAVSIAVGIVTVLQAAALRRTETLVETDAQAAVWDRVLALPVSFFRDHEAGDLAERVMSVATIRDLVSGGLVQTVIAGVFASVNFALMLVYSPPLTAAALAATLLAAAILVAGNLVVLRRTRRLVRLEGDLFGEGLQYLEAIATLRSAGAEDRAFARWLERFVAARKVDLAASTVANALVVLAAALPIATAAVFFLMMGFVLSPRPPLGTFVAFNAAFGGFLAGFLAIAAVASRIAAIVVHWERLDPIRDAVPEALDGSPPAGPLSGGVEVSRLTFRYLADGPPVLDGVDLTVEPGAFVAFVGPSGSGKSSLMRVMLGFERPEAGGVYYDGQDLAALDAAALRRQFGVVLQNGQLFAASVHDNIAAGRPIDREAAREAARAAALLEEIDAMPGGMDTTLAGNRSLSAGQRQRLLIARALAGEPRILFMDEATSALDNVTQAKVADALSRMRLTRIVIAHRLSTVKEADTIHVMERGRIVESGDYDTLMRTGRLFPDLARRQRI